ncbi:hypothetical protein G4Y73_10140 [Wenzhouxiangella sp. XN201]|uniref:S1 family peptidase n=1 Tax=Wenzhouxiangella sp. XN201 TaxID=2710755 RepID=UPI0013C7FDA0|nr:S1 family peptidase [Wenzhouxiangella sp. XN201]NEZ04507.1 hypothetical protein [Wenzhouxiangella sp. XN201]
MKKSIDHSKMLIIIALILFAPFALAGTIGQQTDILKQVQELYGSTEEQAILRLAKEAEATDFARKIEASSIASYAGSWFDAESLSLKVAISDRNDEDFVERMGGDPVLVQRSLDDLVRARTALKSLLASDTRLAHAIVRIAVNPRINAVEVDFKDENSAFIEAAMVGLQIRDSVHVREVSSLPVFSSGALRGAVPTRNSTWGASDPDKTFEDFKCSAGFAVEGGYVTAGHCGYVGNDIVTPTEVALGTVQQSDWGPEDRGWVDTTSAWNPVPEVQGYGSGVFSIPAEWAGLDRALIGNTVCRYGGTSGGPHCGTINAWDAEQAFDLPYYPYSITIDGVTEVNGSCSEPGDSGGSWVGAGTLQAQGTNVGVDPAGSTCETGADRTFFWPADDSTDAFSLTMLTSHGVNPPVNTSICPDTTLHAPENFFCALDNIHSQGWPEISWTSSTGHSSTSVVLTGTCSSGQPVQVNLATTNPYGTTLDQYSFTCP